MLKQSARAEQRAGARKKGLHVVSLLQRMCANLHIKLLSWR